MSQCLFGVVRSLRQAAPSRSASSSSLASRFSCRGNRSHCRFKEKAKLQPVYVSCCGAWVGLWHQGDPPRPCSILVRSWGVQRTRPAPASGEGTVHGPWLPDARTFYVGPLADDGAALRSDTDPQHGPRRVRRTTNDHCRRPRRATSARPEDWR